MAAISASLNPRESLVLGTQGQVENLRKMLVAMVDDVRVALIKLAERTCAIRAVKSADDEKRNRVAREVFDIYAPLAHRLGIGHIKIGRESCRESVCQYVTVPVVAGS